MFSALGHVFFIIYVELKKSTTLHTCNLQIYIFNELIICSAATPVSLIWLFLQVVASSLQPISNKETSWSSIEGSLLMQLKLNTDVTCTPAHVQASCLNSYGSRRLCGKFKMTECLHFYCKVRISEANISYCSLTSPYLQYPAPSVPRIYRRGSDGPVEQRDLILTKAPSFPGDPVVPGNSRYWGLTGLPHMLRARQSPYSACVCLL